MNDQTTQTDVPPAEDYNEPSSVELPQPTRPIHRVYASMALVQRAIHSDGIAKSRENKSQGFHFRGIDDAIKSFAPLLDQHQLIIVPAYRQMKVETRTTKAGSPSYNVTMSGTFTFLHTGDGSAVQVGPFYGEASDSGDKAVSKATSIAYRNMLFITFSVPIEGVIGGDPDGVELPETAIEAATFTTRLASAKTKEEAAEIGKELKDAKLPAPMLKQLRAVFTARLRSLKSTP